MGIQVNMTDGSSKFYPEGNIAEADPSNNLIVERTDDQSRHGEFVAIVADGGWTSAYLVNDAVERKPDTPGI